MQLFRRGETPFITDVARYAGTHRGLTDGLHCWEIKDPREQPFRDILEAACQGVSQCHSIPQSVLLLIDVFLRGGTVESSEVYAPNITLTGKERAESDTDLLYRGPKFDIRRLVVENMDAADSFPARRLLSIIATDNGEEPFCAGTLSCIVRVGGDEFFLAPAHIFMPRAQEDTEEDGSSIEDSESESDSDYGAGMLRAGSAAPPYLRFDPDHITDSTAQESPSGSWDMLEDGVAPQSPTNPSAAPEGFVIFSPEHDYALLPTPKGRTFYLDLCSISNRIVAPVSTGTFTVSVVTPSRGVMYGLLDGRPTLMRLPYSRRFTNLYPATFPYPISSGDCGSLVIDYTTKQIYGFVVAASVEGKVAYIISADEVVQDITVRLGRHGQSSEGIVFEDGNSPRPFEYGELGTLSSPGLDAPSTTSLLLRRLHLNQSKESLAQMLSWCNELLVGLQLLPVEQSKDLGFLSAILTFKSRAGALEAKRVLDERQLITGDVRMIAEILPNNPSEPTPTQQPTQPQAISKQHSYQGSNTPPQLAHPTDQNPQRITLHEPGSQRQLERQYRVGNSPRICTTRG
ncbi:cell cycle RNA binding protein whi3 [Madurella fahalii]|uniref:Cell cycle RNA binding protein whi3 n=1 Tax=Madurella fahalii TaxID=1157608 RepID=A0ABQ0G4W2_9PEZI